MSITKADDYPIHQISKPVSEVGSERNFYDRYFFNGYSKNDDIYFGAVLCVYPNLNIMDGSFTLAYKGKQYNSRASRILNLERLETEVGQLKVEVIKPLKKLKVSLNDIENNFEADLIITGKFEPMREPQMQLYDGPRLIMDTCRLTQQGSWSGFIKINGEKIDVNEKDFVGTRDRSWGVRPVGAYDSQPVAPFNMPQFYWLWAPFHFDDIAAHVYFIDKANGLSDTVLGVIQGPNYKNEFELHNVEKKVSYAPKSRRIESMIISALDKNGNNIEMTIDCGTKVFMCGLGYMHPEWGHGHNKGDFAKHFDEYNLNEDPGDPPYLHIQALSNAVLKIADKTYHGRGVLEQLILGAHEPSGFVDLFDKP